ncbi:cysteine protease, putative [Babesia caballi]|uniref:Cysteine protease, putative n=1 Tax=Babesia caballi TaxID=5871 RepID=A0AAV4LWN0_BABCB|nr:cysteine protease, putative [Babesia caballi]
MAGQNIEGATAPPLDLLRQENEGVILIPLGVSEPNSIDVEPTPANNGQTDAAPDRNRRRRSSCKKFFLALFMLLLVLAIIGSGLYYFLYCREKPKEEKLLPIKKGEPSFLHRWISPLGFQSEEHINKAVTNLIELRTEAQNLNLEVIQGSMRACISRGWELNCVDRSKNIKGVLLWELRAVARELAARSRGAFDAKQEIENILTYKKFTSVMGVRYTDEKSFATRYMNFRENRKMVEEHNNNPDRRYDMAYSFATEHGDTQLGVSIASTVSTHNMYEYAGGEFVVKNKSTIKVEPGDEIIHKDWRLANAVGPVVDQGSCGSCWAVAAASLVDAYRSIKTGLLVAHSSQQLLDCTSRRYNCIAGGDHKVALEYAAEHGLCTADTYSYVGKAMACQRQSCGQKFKVDNIVKLTGEDLEKHIKTHGPAIVTLRISRAFMHYSNGIYDGPCDSSIHHSALVVGYGENVKLGVKFWIVKNSWSEAWGEDGYFKLYRGPTAMSAGAPAFCSFDKHAFGLRT